MTTVPLAEIKVKFFVMMIEQNKKRRREKRLVSKHVGTFFLKPGELTSVRSKANCKFLFAKMTRKLLSGWCLMLEELINQRPFHTHSTKWNVFNHYCLNSLIDLSTVLFVFRYVCDQHQWPFLMNFREEWLGRKKAPIQLRENPLETSLELITILVQRSLQRVSARDKRRCWSD